MCPEDLIRLKGRKGKKAKSNGTQKLFRKRDNELMKGNKLLAGTLSATMVLGTMSFPAFADDGAAVVKTTEELKAALADKTVTTITIDGTIDAQGVDFSTADGITIKGDLSDGDDVLNFSGAPKPISITFADVTLAWPNADYQGLQHSTKLTYNNCTIKGQPFLYAADEIFNGCTFIQESPDAYNVWTYGAKNVEFNNCVFNSAGKSVLIYNEGSLTDGSVSVENCTFNASASAEGKAAIEIDSTYSNYSVDIDNKTTATGFAAGSTSGSSLYNVKKYKVVTDDADNSKKLNTEIKVNGEAVMPLSEEKQAEAFAGSVAKVGNKFYTDFTSAFNAANAMTEPAVIDCLADEITTNKGRYAIKNSITINGNGATIKNSGNLNSSVEFSTEELDADKFTSDITFTVNNLNNIAVWGYRKSNTAFNVALNGCKDVDRIYITGTNGTTNINVDDCTFTKYDSANNDTSIYTNNPGTLTVTNSTFTAIPIAININNKSDGERKINISGCKFINCGEPSNKSNPNYAAPIRFVTTRDNGKITSEVSDNTITNDDPSKKTHGDILLGDGRDGKASTSNIEVIVSGNKSDLTVKNEYPDGTATVSKDIPAGASATVSNKVVADTVALKFVPTADERVYDIVLSGEGKNINRLNAAEFTFNLSNTAMRYEIKAADKLTTLQPDADKYVFYFDGKDAVNNADSGEDITIGTVAFEGFGAFTFEATKGKATATTTEDNLVTEFVTTAETGKGTLKIADEANKINAEIKVPKQKLAINVLMNHPVAANAADYQDMTVAISGGDLAGKVLTYKLGDVDTDVDETTKTVAQTNGSYKIETELTQNRLYTVTVSGAGYRTARYTVTMTEDKTMNVWNNVMSNEIVVVDDTKATKNFLAGDIIKDGIINIYDLSAVVAYFGTDNLVSDHPSYAKYDLNRDGVIDMIDISIVLTSWGE